MHTKIWLGNPKKDCMHGKPATQNEQLKYTDVLYYKYLYVLLVELDKTSLNHN